MKNNQPTCRIYSRSRLKIFKPKRNYRKYKRQNNKIFYILAILTVSSITCITIFKSINPIFETVCLDRAKAIATQITNEETTKAITQYNYNEIFNIQTDDKGNIQMISANIFKINEITSNASTYIQQAIDNEEKAKLKIPLGSFTGIKILAGMGPNITLKISSDGKVDTELKSEFIAKGINQTLHRIYLQIDCEINILTPFETIKEKTSNQLLLAENVLMGQIPETYYNIEGLEKTQELLDTIN